MVTIRQILISFKEGGVMKVSSTIADTNCGVVVKVEDVLTAARVATCSA